MRTIRFGMLAAVASLSCAVAGQAAEKIPAVGDEAKDFELPDVTDKPVKLSKLVEGGPVVLIVLRGYPGYQCPLCNEQAADFFNRAEKFREKKTRVLFVYPGPADHLKRYAEEFLAERKLPEGYYLVTDSDFKFTNDYGLRWKEPKETAYPSTFVIGTDRKVKYVHTSKRHDGRAKSEDVLKALEGK
jgi:peroxiredoxin Q/BCP